MSVYTTEIASDKIPSDNPVHQRLLKGYFASKPFVSGNILELGCGEGRGVEEVGVLGDNYTGIDKIDSVVNNLRTKFSAYRFEQGTFPPIPFPDNSFDTVITLHVIEHIKDDHLFMEEIFRVLNPGGKALISTPNIKMSLSRNPWHVREYTSMGLSELAKTCFSHVEMKGIAGNKKVMEYYERNKQGVEKIMKYDFLNLQYRLPAPLLRIPYDLLNRLNRNSLQNESDELVASITIEDYLIEDDKETNLDLFCIATK